MTAAMRLMERCGVNDSLIGDLAEARMRHGQIWLWRQALGAIVTASARDLTAHPIRAFGAVVLSMVLLRLFQVPMEWLWAQIGGPFGDIVKRVGLRHQLALTAGIVRTIFFWPLSFGVGWLVTRLHRRRTPATAFLFLAVTTFLAAPGYWRQVVNALDQPRFRPYLASQTLAMIVFNVSFIAGALWAQGQKDRSPAGTRQLDPS